jgi:hypothetical protein
MLTAATGVSNAALGGIDIVVINRLNARAPGDDRWRGSRVKASEEGFSEAPLAERYLGTSDLHLPSWYGSSEVMPCLYS